MALHAMGRERGDSMALGGGNASSSSIALLQERFRQLQKMRERREEMELLKLFNEPETLTQKEYERSGNLLVHPEMIYHQATTATTTNATTTTTRTRSSFQDCLSLGLDLYGKNTEHQPLKTPPYRDFWSMDSVTVGASRSYDKPDVDTSLHL